MRPLSALCELSLGSLYRELGEPDAARRALASARSRLVSLDMTHWLPELEQELRACP